MLVAQFSLNLLLSVHFPNTSPMENFPTRHLSNTIIPRQDNFPTGCFPDHNAFLHFLLPCLFVELGLIYRTHKDVSLILLEFRDELKYIYLYCLKDLSPTAIPVINL